MFYLQILDTFGYGYCYFWCLTSGMADASTLASWGTLLGHLIARIPTESPAKTRNCVLTCVTCYDFRAICIVFYENTIFKSSVILFCFNLNLEIFDSLMGKPQTPHFYDFGRVPEPQNQYYSPGYLGEFKQKSCIFWKHIIFTNPNNSDFEMVGDCGKGGHRKIPTIRLITFRKSWIRDQSLPENMKLEFGKSSKLCNQWTKNLWNQETKPLWSQETKKSRNQRPRN